MKVYKPIRLDNSSSFSHLHHFLLDDFEFLVALEFLFRYALLDLCTLHFGGAQLLLCLATLELIAVESLHRLMKLLQHTQNLLVYLVADLATTLIDALTIIVDGLKALHKLVGVNVGQCRVIASQ